ncbi:hypothetical protein ACQY0O_007264 [Thecaphora frezii]
MPAPLIPAERLRDALEVVRQSIEQFSANYRTWLTQAPAYSTAPALLGVGSPDAAAPPSISRGDSDNSSSGGGGGKRLAFQPNAETLARAYCPIAGPRWDEHRTKLLASTSIKGLTILRNQIDAELVTLQKIAAENGNWQDPHPFSNGPHHIHYWEEILYVALTSGPVVSIQDRFSFDMDMAVRRKKRLQRSKTKAINSQSCKVDIVSRGGDRWTRLFITKYERLRAEFREAESYMVESDESDEDEDNGSGNFDGKQAAGGGPGLAEQEKDQGRDPALDSAARNCSLMKTIRELRAAADTEAHARLQRSAESGRPTDVFRPIEVELVVTRIDIARQPQGGDAAAAEEYSSKSFYELDESSRFQARIRAIVKEAEKLDIRIVCGFRHLPSELFGRFEYPSVAIYGSELPVGLPRIPMPPPRPNWKTTRRVNLDVTAMIALVSDTTHGIFDQPAAGADGPSARPKADDADPTFQRHFRTFSIRKEALEARAAELSLQDDQSEEAARAMDSAASKEGRALAIQLERELTLETLFDAILEPILGRDTGLEGDPGRKVELYATVGAFDRLRRVSSTVGGVNEKRRVAALLGENGVTPDNFWRGSKWAAAEYAPLRECLQLPVQPLSDLGPGGFASIDQLCDLYPDLARQHFVSHMIDTLESCLTELWGPEWQQISEDLPRSKYKKLKQHSIHQAGGQTYTTLRSMHACARYGMTTLTSNMDSIQWLLKEMNRRPYSSTTRALLERAKAQDVNVLFDPRANYEACFLLLHPRSLSEQMRVTSAAPPWREVLAGFQGGTDATPSGASTPKSEVSPEGRKRTGIRSGSPAIAHSSGNGASSVDHAEGNEGHSCGPGSATSKSASPSQSFFCEAEITQARHRTRPLPVRDKGSLSIATGDGDSAVLALGLQELSYPAALTNTKGALGQRIKAWIRGPKQPARLRIRHYRWWPLAPVERFWMRFTNPVAWRDPRVARSSYEFPDECVSISGSGSDSVAGLPNLGGPLDGGAQRRRKQRRPSLGFGWLDGVYRDLRTNRLHWAILCATYAAWILGFGFVARALWYNASITGADGVARDPNFFSCTTTLWLRNGGCGLDGKGCEPFATGANVSGTAFRCPRGCSGVTLLNPRTVGGEQVNYVPLVVGGGDAQRTYRSDSFVCAAAAHAGVLDDSRGGCGSVRLVGAFASYRGSASHGFESIGFDGTFPSSFRFEPTSEPVDCTDRRGQMYALNAIMSAFVGFVLRPRRIVWFWTLACLGFWHVNMASEPRDYPPPIGEAVGDFLPYLFGCYVIWRVAVRFVWPAFERLPLEREVWTLGAWWIGTLMNVVFAGVPISRLTVHDISQRPGALTALIVIIAIVIVIAANQLLVIRKAGYLPKYLLLYAVGGVLIGLAAAAPDETLRLHHYIAALVLLPACAFPTRLSLLYVAFLLGMYTNGIARWGFDGLLQDVATVRGDATAGTGRPTFVTNSTNWSPDSGIIEWAAIDGEQKKDWNGFNLLVDDVLRYQGSATLFNLSTLPDRFASQHELDGDASPALSNQTILQAPHYLRIAFTSDGDPGDYTMPATAFLSNGTWRDPRPGAT